MLTWAIESFRSKLALVTSFQDEGMVLVHMAAGISPNVRVVTLDTGRLPRETYEMIELVRSRYGLRVEVVLPDATEVERMSALHGPNLFYNSVPLRTLCCQVRKVRPLERKLAGFDAWVVGLRRDHGADRETIAKVESSGSRTKISPLADWSESQVADYLRANDVPRHPLYSRGYTSIGCDPCTRATLPGEGKRAGRWWWETDAAKECGLHFSPAGTALRTVDVLLSELLSNPDAT